MKTNKILIVILLLFFNSGVQAGRGEGLVNIEHVGSWGGKDLVFFYTPTHLDRPVCNDYHERWVLNLSSTVGKYQYSLLLSAVAANKPLLIQGTNSCNAYSGSETVEWIGFIQ